MPNGSRARNRRPSWVPASILGAAVLLALDPLPFTSPVPPAQEIPAWATDPTPVRRPSPRPEVTVAAFTYRCTDCHDLFPSPPETYRTLTQHTEIRLNHGINNHCLNCHHRTNRDAFADARGHEIPWDQPQRLCATCHGPVFRDWQHGSHGRTNGYWDTTQGPRERRRCIECHDPHQPPFPPMQPAPAPRTLRMGPQGLVRHGADRNPLRVTTPREDTHEKD